jgi:hypothetical protein
MHSPYQPDFFKRHPDYFSFAFVRNPFDVMVSWYRKLVHIKEHSPESLLEFLTMFPKKNILKTQASYIVLDNKIAVDKLGRFENFESDFTEICKKLGLEPADDRVVNMSYNPNNKHYREYYDEKTKAFVENKFARDLEVFGYEF